MPTPRLKLHASEARSGAKSTATAHLNSPTEVTSPAQLPKAHAVALDFPYVVGGANAAVITGAAYANGYDYVNNGGDERSFSRTSAKGLPARFNGSYISSGDTIGTGSRHLAATGSQSGPPGSSSITQCMQTPRNHPTFPEHAPGQRPASC